ncbi:MAG: hypothetical protein ACI4SK_06120 [Christensenellales bacterium]
MNFFRNTATAQAVIVIVAALVAAIRFIFKKDGCKKNCDGCVYRCDKRKSQK